ncbi:hypothetical protein K439DRAFT_600704 [Ramaria rubella]|nr:hypothetical protein K439DRAFT_600704 [Ramaria rubella]
MDTVPPVYHHTACTDCGSPYRGFTACQGKSTLENRGRIMQMCSNKICHNTVFHTTPFPSYEDAQRMSIYYNQMAPNLPAPALPGVLPQPAPLLQQLHPPFAYAIQLPAHPGPFPPPPTPYLALPIPPQPSVPPQPQPPAGPVENGKRLSLPGQALREEKKT